ncbi:MAG: hypothetical protein K0S28_2418 [Paucimonas sp.]|nr:hypothetical protein [Paucimonas sp.]
MRQPGFLLLELPPKYSMNFKPRLEAYLLHISNFCVSVTAGKSG